MKMDDSHGLLELKDDQGQGRMMRKNEINNNALFNV